MLLGLPQAKEVAWNTEADNGGSNARAVVRSHSEASTPAVLKETCTSRRDDMWPRQPHTGAKDRRELNSGANQLFTIQEEQDEHEHKVTSGAPDYRELVIAAMDACRRSVAEIRATRRTRRIIRFRGIGGLLFTRLGESPLAVWELTHLGVIRRGGIHKLEELEETRSAHPKRGTRDGLHGMNDERTRVSDDSIRSHLTIHGKARKRDGEAAAIVWRGIRWRFAVTTRRHANRWQQAMRDGQAAAIVRRGTRWRSAVSTRRRANTAGIFFALRRASTRWRRFAGHFRPSAFCDAIVRASTRWRVRVLRSAGLLLNNAI